jgi:hypothetical protein
MKTLTRTKADPGAEKYTFLSGLKKLVDTDRDNIKSSKSAEYWSSRGFVEFYKKISNKPPKLDNKFFDQDPVLALQKTFNLKAIQFGNWENNETRFNYIFACISAFFDLDLLLNFKENLGFGILTLSLGSRGSGKALAHFEPDKYIINLTRYKRADKYEKKYNTRLPGDQEEKTEFLFLHTGGIGSLAHEYGHFLDSVGGSYFEPGSSYGLTFGREVSPKLSYDYIVANKYNKAHKLRYLTNEIIYYTCYSPDKRDNLFKYSDYYERLKKSQKNVYWFRHCELFARSWEVYITLLQKENKLQNIFLSKFKYHPDVYPTEKELIQSGVKDLFDKLVTGFRYFAKEKNLMLKL